MLRIHELRAADILFMSETYNLYACKIHMFLFQIHKHGATRCAPAGAFFPAKYHVLFCKYTETLFLCIQRVKQALSKLGATRCAPAGAFFPAK